MNTIPMCWKCRSVITQHVTEWEDGVEYLTGAMKMVGCVENDEISCYSTANGRCPLIDNPDE